MNPLLPPATCWELMRLLGGDPETEQAVMMFIRRRWNVTNLWRLPERVANEVLKRPADFIARAKAESNQPF